MKQPYISPFIKKEVEILEIENITAEDFWEKDGCPVLTEEDLEKIAEYWKELKVGDDE